MKKHFAILILSLAAFASAQAQYSHVYENASGLHLGLQPQSLVGFNGALPTPQRNGIAQNALATTSATGSITFTAAPVALTWASGTLSLTVNPSVGDTVVLGSGTYNFVTALSGTTTNQAVIGPNLQQTIFALSGAINNATTLTAQAGYNYFLTGSTGNASATAVSGSNFIVATAIASGTAGNGIATTGSFANSGNAWSGSTLSGGAAGDTVAIGGQTYVFAAAVPASGTNLVLVNGTAGTASNLINAINAWSPNVGITFSLPTVSNTTASAIFSGSATTVVTVNALLGGTAGNAIALAKSSSGISLSGSNLSGGVQFTDTNAEANLLNEIRTALVQKGLIKGSQ